MKHHLIPFILTLSLLAAPADGAPQLTLSEQQVINLGRQANPSRMAIAGVQEAAAAKKYLTDDRFNAKLAGGYTYASSNEDAIIQFFPVFHPQRNFNLGLEQNTALGMKAKLGVFGQQLNTADNFISNATQVGTQLGLEIELWQNFLGSLDQADIQAQNLNSEIAKLQAETDLHSFVLDLRKIYWTLVANQVSLELAKELVKTAENQLNDSIRRAGEGAADQGDVARNRALFESRKSAVMGFTYLSEIYLAQLKSLLPELQGKSLKVDTSPRVAAETTARACMVQIQQQPAMDTSHSYLPAIIDLLKEQKTHELKIANAADSMNLKLIGQYQASGVDTSHADAYERFVDEFKNGYQVGIQLQVPLGGDLKKSRENLVASVTNQYAAKIQKLDLQLSSEHEKVRNALLHLNSSLSSQGAIVENLQLSLNQTRKKYAQARIPLSTLILEQDNAFNARLQEIDTKRQIIHLLLDYFKVFNRYPCPANAITGGPS